MTKQVYGETIRLTKTGQVNKSDRTKVIRAIQSEIESKVRGWEFIAMMDGIQSVRANELQREIDALKLELDQTSQVLGLAA
jgi:hypothetical protein